MGGIEKNHLYGSLWRHSQVSFMKANLGRVFFDCPWWNCELRLARRETTWNPSRFEKTEVLLRAKASAEPVDDFGRKVGVVSAVVFFWVGDGSKNKKTYGGLNGKIISKCWEYDGIDGKRRLAGTIFLGILDFDNFFREIHGRNPRACIIIFPNIFREFQYHIAIFSMKITWEIPWKYHNNP